MAPGYLAFNPAVGAILNFANLTRDEADSIGATPAHSHDECRWRDDAQADQCPLVDSEGISQHERFLVPVGPQAGNQSIQAYFKGSAAEYHRRFTAAGITGPDLIARVALLAFVRTCIVWLHKITGDDLIADQVDTWHPDANGWCENNVPTAANIAIWEAYATAIPDRGGSVTVCTGDTICPAMCNKAKFHHWLSGDNASVHDARTRARRSYYDRRDTGGDIYTRWGLDRGVFENITCRVAAHPVKDAVMYARVTDATRPRVRNQVGFGDAQTLGLIQADFARDLEGYFRVFDSARRLADMFNLSVGPAIPETAAEYILNAAIVGHGLAAGHSPLEMHELIDEGAAVTTPGAAMGILVPMTLVGFNGLQLWQQDVLVSGIHASAGPEIALLCGVVEGYAEALHAPLEPDNDLTGTCTCERAKRDSVAMHLSGRGHGRACAEFVAGDARRGGIAGISAGRGVAPAWKVQTDDPNARGTANLATGLRVAMAGSRSQGTGHGAAVGPGSGP